LIGLHPYLPYHVSTVNSVSITGNSIFLFFPLEGRIKIYKNI
jgi:hypothetical protein